jgi:hypothetical protein
LTFLHVRRHESAMARAARPASLMYRSSVALGALLAPALCLRPKPALPFPDVECSPSARPTARRGRLRPVRTADARARNAVHQTVSKHSESKPRGRQLGSSSRHFDSHRAPTAGLGRHGKRFAGDDGNRAQRPRAARATRNAGAFADFAHCQCTRATDCGHKPRGGEEELHCHLR